MNLDPRLSTGRDIALVVLFVAVAAFLGTCTYVSATRSRPAPTELIIGPEPKGTP